MVPEKNELLCEMSELKTLSDKLAGRTLLVVEDNYISFKLIQAILKSSGLNLLHADNGEVAVDLCRKHPEIDMVLMDVMLPIMDGLTATRLILEDRPGLPIIAATANAFAEDRDRCLAAGCIDYITKPIAIDRFYDVLNNYIRTD